MAKARGSGGKRKTKGAKKESELPNPGIKIQTRKIVAEIAVSERNNEEALVADILSSFEAHGGSAENKLDKEFRTWLMKFAQALNKNKIRFQAWSKLESKCDELMLLKELYLFTYIGNTSANVLQDASRFLKEELDKLLPKYVKLHKKTSALFDHPKLRLLTVMSKGLSQIFEEQKYSLATVEQKLELIRAFGEKNGSYKTDARTFHLYGMARTVHEGTGKYHYRELARLTEAACAAHGAEGAPVDVDALKRRVERYIKRMSSRM